MPNGLKVTFLIHAIVGLIISIGFLFFPSMVASIYGFPSFVPVGLARAYGGFVLAVSASSWLASRAKQTQQVKIVVAMEICLTVVSALVTLYSLFFESAPVMEWSTLAIFVIFGILFISFYGQVSKD